MVCRVKKWFESYHCNTPFFIRTMRLKIAKNKKNLSTMLVDEPEITQFQAI